MCAFVLVDQLDLCATVHLLCCYHRCFGHTPPLSYQQEMILCLHAEWHRKLGKCEQRMLNKFPCSMQAESTLFHLDSIVLFAVNAVFVLQHILPLFSVQTELFFTMNTTCSHAKSSFIWLFVNIKINEWQKTLHLPKNYPNKKKRTNNNHDDDKSC